MELIKNLIRQSNLIKIMQFYHELKELLLVMVNQINCYLKNSILSCILEDHFKITVTERYMAWCGVLVRCGVVFLPIIISPQQKLF